MSVLCRGWLWIGLLAAQMWLAPMAHADIDCNLTTAGLEFGTTVDGASDADSSTTLTLLCTTSGGKNEVNDVNICGAIGEGTQGGGQGIVPRRMVTAAGDTLEFNVYKTAARTLSEVWGEVVGGTPSPLSATFRYPNDAGTISVPITVYGRVPVQDGLAAGDYNNPLDVHLHYRYNVENNDQKPFNPPAGCLPSGGGAGGGSKVYTFNAHASVPKACKITAASTLKFPTAPGLIAIDQASSSVISLVCNTPWQLALDNGSNPLGAQRRMYDTVSLSYLNYELYRDPARTQRWGNSVGVDTHDLDGTSDSQEVTVYGTVPAPQSVPAGDYSDTITVLVTY